MATILVIDDSESVLQRVQDDLGGAGHEVLAHGSAKEALAALQTRRVDLVVADIYMPDMDGLELLCAARAAGIDVPFIVISTKPKPLNMFGPAQALGASAALQKPFTRERLLEVVSSVLEGRAPAGTGAGKPDRRSRAYRAVCRLDPLSHKQ